MEIYLITNLINGKQYVGQTKHTKEKRWKSHFSGNLYIDKAIRKYGTENFSLETLQDIDDITKLNEAEIYWISTLNTLVPNGYNISRGGNQKIGFKPSITNIAECVRYQWYPKIVSNHQPYHLKVYYIDKYEAIKYMQDHSIISIDENIAKEISKFIEFYPSISGFLQDYEIYEAYHYSVLNALNNGELLDVSERETC